MEIEDELIFLRKQQVGECISLVLLESTGIMCPAVISC